MVTIWGTGQKLYTITNLLCTVSIRGVKYGRFGGEGCTKTGQFFCPVFKNWTKIIGTPIGAHPQRLGLRPSRELG